MRRGTLAIIAVAACTGTAPGFEGSARPVKVDVTEDSGFDAGCLGVSSPPDGTCGCHADCGSGAVCAYERELAVPGGRCLVPCDAGAPAPAGYHCRDLAGAFLVRLCSASQPCRSGYSCAVLRDAGGIGECDPQCGRDSECPTTGHCDLYTGLCQPELDGGFGLNALCQRGDQCKSGNCFPASSGAFCASNCTTTDATCAEGARCIGVGVEPGNTIGLCFFPCDGGACSPTFHCTANNNCLPTF